MNYAETGELKTRRCRCHRGIEENREIFRLIHEKFQNSSNDLAFTVHELVIMYDRQTHVCPEKPRDNSESSYIQIKKYAFLKYSEKLQISGILLADIKCKTNTFHNI